MKMSIDLKNKLVPCGQSRSILPKVGQIQGNCLHFQPCNAFINFPASITLLVLRCTWGLLVKKNQVDLITYWLLLGQMGSNGVIESQKHQFFDFWGLDAPVQATNEF